ncbi:MAG: phosphoglucosamine mutase [Clostridia bacterium]|nr:phosphoglucosamine mutase [Clostridia bacterium]
MGKYFGTDGFRGEANISLNADHAYKIGRFLGSYFGKNGHKCRVVVGKDPRRSSYMLEYAIVAGLTASGADVYMLHVITTPGVSYVTRVDEFDLGIMISASHNPYTDNGIKLLNSRGEKMEDSVIELLEAYLDGDAGDLGENGELPFATGKSIGKIVDYMSGRNRYVAYLISIASHSFRKLKIGLDCANGSSWMIARNVFEALGAKVFVINAEPNGLNINVNAGSTHIDVLRSVVVENSLDIGFAYDGDADRCIAVDEKGNVITGDHILYILGKNFSSKGMLSGNSIVTTVMSNFGLYKALDALGISYEKTAVGDKYVYERMLEKGYSLGGEQSGHIIISKYATTGDGILTSIMLTESLLEARFPASKLSDGFNVYPQVLKNIRVKDMSSILNDPEVKSVIDSVSERLGESGRILVRKSGTEPVIRIMVESGDSESCERYVNEVISVISAKNSENP